MSKRFIILGSLALLLGGAAVFVEAKIGWSFVIGILRYDTRREGDLKVGDLAPVAELHATEDGRVVRLLEKPPDRPVILVFGSFT